MNYDNIYTLIEKYFDGETSIKEEETLKTFFQDSKDIPHELIRVKSHFVALNMLASENLDESFDNKILETVTGKTSIVDADNNTKMRKQVIKHPFSYFISAVAASILILLTIWSTTDLLKIKKLPIKNNNTALAYKQATEALSILSKNFDYGLSQTQQLAEPLNKSINMLNNIGKVNKSIESLQPIGNLSNMEIIKYNK